MKKPLQMTILGASILLMGAAFADEDHHDDHSHDDHGPLVNHFDGHADIMLVDDPDHGFEFLIALEEHDHDHDHGHGEEDDPHDDPAHDDHGGHTDDHGHDHGDGHHPDEVRFILGGFAVSTVPDNAGYAFLGDPGRRIYLSPQQPTDGVPFIGWNTEALDTAVFDNGVEIELHGVEGPGTVFLYEVDGFGAVTVRWDSGDPGEDALTMPAGIHRHLNLAVSEPGTYELELHARADLSTGSTVEAHGHVILQAGGMEGFMGPNLQLHHDWLEAETGGLLYTAGWPWVWSPEEGWLLAWGDGGPIHYYFRDRDATWIWTSPFIFPWYGTLDDTDWGIWGGE
jgi:hypothetical protein